MHLKQKRAVFPGNAATAIFPKNSILPAGGFGHLLMALMLLLTLTGCTHQSPWHIEEVTGHLPDLDFSLTADNGRAVTGEQFEGYLLLLYFGYTHCDAECPVSLARLANVVRLLGDGENRVRILFVSLDPGRDSPEVLNKYLAQFDCEQAIGLTGTTGDIERLAKKYRTAYRPSVRIRETTAIEHGDAVYIFDVKRRARLLATSSSSDKHLAEDLRRLMQSGY
jgi:protein SCO1/2